MRHHLLSDVKQTQGCILLNYLSVISSKFIQKFAQNWQYFTLIDQSVPLITVTSIVYLGRNQLWADLHSARTVKRTIQLQYYCQFFENMTFKRPVKDTKLYTYYIFSPLLYEHKREHTILWEWKCALNFSKI